MKKVLLILKIYVLLYACCRNNIETKTFDLSTNWTLVNSEFGIVIPNITIPNSVHSILQSVDLIDEPLYGYNDVNLRWIVYADAWMLKNEFDMGPTVPVTASLILDSIDTFASVYLNDKSILNASNQFVRYEIVDLDRMLVHGLNTIEVRFDSSVKRAAELAKQYPYRIPPTCTPKVQHGECQVNMIRKQQCSFSWDWGPAFAPIGINGPVLIKTLDEQENFDFDFSVSVYPNDMSADPSKWVWLLDIDMAINQTASMTFTSARVEASIDTLAYKTFTDVNVSTQNSRVRVTFTLDSHVDLWWPSGYGDQSLYDLDVTVWGDTTKVAKKKRIGFRHVELVQRQVDSDPHLGLTFYFAINKKPVFLKGSNWIPADPFQERISSYKLKWLLNSAAKANMNVLRVWGGGVYEKEEFYDIADELGIMIWQDFMFACGTYPTNKEFLENVAYEVRHQVSRLKHHPSIIVWAGNNENEAAIAQNWYDTNPEKKRYADDYRALYIKTIMAIVQENDPTASRPFVSSSPTNGKESESEDWIALDPASLNYGDLHYYNYEMNAWLPDAFPIPRLMSEYGIQSLPSYATLSDVYAMPRDADLYGEMNAHRQHHDNGNRQVQNEIENNLKMPSDESPLDPISKFKTIIYLSQINQAMHYKTAIEVFRRWRNLYDAKTGQGYCMGSMYWQFNDLWQAPTWSTIEYHKEAGKWKLAHYYAQKSYAPLIISPVINKTTSSIDLYAISDLYTATSGRFQLKIVSYSSLAPRFSKWIDFTARAFDLTLLGSVRLDDIKKYTGCELDTAESCLLSIDESSNFMLFNTKLAQVTNLQVAKLSISSVTSIGKGAFSILLSTDQVALFVWVDLTTTAFHGIFSDNGFHMHTPTRTVNFYTDNESVDENVLRSHLSVQTLANSYFSN